jgi:hypothetical protein
MDGAPGHSKGMPTMAFPAVGRSVQGGATMLAEVPRRARPYVNRADWYYHYVPIYLYCIIPGEFKNFLIN